MYQTRAELSKKIPLPRKGTKYVARALSNVKESVPVVIAVRDMLKLARTSKEVKEMVKQKLLKINGRIVRDIRDPIKIFNLFEADKKYTLTLSETGKFRLAETSAPERICKLVNKKTLKRNKTQLNFHDGTNILTDKKININDTVHLDLSGKIKAINPIEIGKNCLVISGKNLGRKGRIVEILKKSSKVEFEGVDNPTEIENGRLVVL